MAIMLITHDMGVIAGAADRMAVMYAGRIVEIGSARDVIGKPLHPYSVGLIGIDPETRFRSRPPRSDSGSMPRLTSIPSGCPFIHAAARIRTVLEHAT